MMGGTGVGRAASPSVGACCWGIPNPSGEAARQCQWPRGDGLPLAALAPHVHVCARARMHPKPEGGTRRAGPQLPARTPAARSARPGPIAAPRTTARVSGAPRQGRCGLESDGKGSARRRSAYDAPCHSHHPSELRAINLERNKRRGVHRQRRPHHSRPEVRPMWSRRATRR